MDAIILGIGALLSSSLFGYSPTPQQPEGPPPPEQRAVRTTLRRGETLLTVLKRFHLDAPSAHALIDTIRPFVNPRKMKAGQPIQVMLDPDKNTVKRLEYPLSDTVIELKLTPDGWLAETREIPSVNKVRVVRGVVRDSLYQNGIETGLSPGQILDLADIFKSDIDFFSDFQPEDEFGVAFEEVVYADGRKEKGRILAAGLTASRDPFYAFYYPSKKHGGYFDLRGRSLGRAFLRAPLSYRRISSRYSLNRRHPIFRTLRPHRAIDYAAPFGTPVVTIGGGTVQYAGWRGGYGKLVEIHHPNGYATRYAHLSRYASGIHKGQRVGQGEVIGYVGQTGHATGAHLHFELLKGGKKINFLSLRIPKLQRLTGRQFTLFTRLRDERLALLGSEAADLLN